MDPHFHDASAGGPNLPVECALGSVRGAHARRVQQMVAASARRCTPGWRGAAEDHERGSVKKAFLERSPNQADRATHRKYDVDVALTGPTGSSR